MFLHVDYVSSHRISVFSALPVGMIGSNAARPTMPSGEWAPQSPAVRVTCAATSNAMNRPIQGGMIRNPTASIPMRPSSQPGQRQMLQPQVMNMGKVVPVLFAFHFYAFLEGERNSSLSSVRLVICGLGNPPPPPPSPWQAIISGILLKISAQGHRITGFPVK